MRASLLLSLVFTLSASAQTPLRVGVPISDSLGAHQEHVYTARLGAGEIVAGDADGPHVDMVVRVVGPDGETVDEFDTGARGPEPFRFTTEAAGTYQIIALPFEDESGRYTITLRLAEARATDAAGRVRQSLAAYGDGRPDVSVAILRDGEIAFATTTGSAETRFDTGALAEPITAVAALRLADRGVLDLDAPVQTYLPDLPTPTGPVTVRDLVEHRTGYHDTARVYALARPGRTITQGAADTVVTRQPPPDEPTRFRPSGGRTDYALLARVLEAATGEPFEAILRETVFEPFGMTETRTRTAPDQPIPGEAARYTGPGASVPLPPSRDGMYGAGNLFTTARDLGLFAEALLADTDLLARIAPPDVRQRTTGGYGFDIEPAADGRRLVARGWARGANARLVVEPQARAGYAILAGFSGAFRGRTGVPVYLVEHETFGERPPGPPPAPSSPPYVETPRAPDRTEEADYYGRYAGSALGDVLTVRENEYGFASAFAQDGREFPLRSGGQEELASRSSDLPLGYVWFEYDEAGTPVAFVLRGEGVRGLRYTRQSD